MYTPILLALNFLAAALLLGCGLDDTSTGNPPGEGPVICTAFVAPSVVATIVDVSGNPLPDAVVSYTVNGAGPYPSESNFGNQFTAGYETTGDFVVTATHLGYNANTSSATVVMDDAGCHVITQACEIQLDPQ